MLLYISVGTLSEVGHVSSISIETASVVHIHMSCIFSNVETVFYNVLLVQETLDWCALH